MFDKIGRWLVSHPYWMLTFVTFAALAPFMAKPFNLDDPLFIWAARQIHAHPLNPYGFNVEWGWTASPMWQVTQNPPVACYFIALAAMVFGWSETGLHFAFLLPAIAVILGTYRLAKNFCGQPVLAAMITLFAPVVMVSSLTVMCDVTMLAFWMWAVILWMEGIEQKAPAKLAAAGLLIAFAEMSKYYGACLLPLLAAYSFAGRHPLRRWAPFLSIPLLVLCAYQYATRNFYGESLLYRAMDCASLSKVFFGFSKFQNGLIALSFTGGCAASAVLFTPLVWRKRGLIMLAFGMALIAVVVFLYAALWKKYGTLQGLPLTSAKIQATFWATGGLCVLALAVADICRHRDARSLLLFLWVAGTFIFAAFCNWTVNARSILPLAPALAILVARRLEEKIPATKKLWPTGILAGLLAGYSLAWAVTMSDFSVAGACRQSAQEICDKYGGGPGTLWFQGHWGFQYYMNELGAIALDFKSSPLKPGDLLAVPPANSNILLLDPGKTALLEVFNIPGAQWLSTWNPALGAGFYASADGPLPFAFGPVPPETVFVYALRFPPAIAQKNLK